MCTRTNNYANTGLVTISTANPYLDGTGTLGLVLTAASGPTADGTTITPITIKATGSTSEGMVRLFTYDAVNYYLWKEVYIPAVTQTSVVEAFQVTVYDNLNLAPGETLWASTQNANSFNIYANGIDWQNCSCTSTCTCGDSLGVASTGIANISTANSNLDGTGTIGTVLTVPTGSLVYGTTIPVINIKAAQSSSQGMIRFFINNGSANFLIWEVPIPASTQTGVRPTYRTECIAMIELQAGYSLCASTQNAESFNVIVFASNITNCSC